MVQGERHQLDSSVLVEVFSHGTPRRRERQRAVRGYLFSQVGRNVKGLLSIPALGEVIYSIRDNLPNLEDRLRALRALEDFLESSDVEFNSPNARAYEIATEILRNDSRVETADALRVAEAIQAEAVLVTLDRVLLESRYLKARRDVKIIAPPGVPLSFYGEYHE